MKNKRLVLIICTICLLLLVPLVLTLFTDYLNWSAFDFVIFGVLLLLGGLMFELMARKVGNFKLRYILLVVLFIVLILVWVELAVGIFGTSFAGE